MSRYNNTGSRVDSSWDNGDWASGGGASGSWSSSSGGSSGSFGPVAEPRGGGLDQWVVESQKLYSNIQTISANVQDIERQIAFLGSNDDNEELRARIKAKVDDTRLRIKVSDDCIKTLNRLENAGGSAAENSKRRMVLSKASKDFKLLLSRFKQVAQIWVTKSQTTPRSTTPYSGQLGPEHYYQQPPSGFESQSLLNQQQHQQQVQQFNRYDNEIQFREYMANERDQEARDIEQGVADLAQIFDDFKTAVDAQQEYVDSIENNIIQAVDHTRQGVTQLEAAKGHQQSARSKLYCVALIIIVILGIMVALAALGVTIHYLA